MPLKLNSKNILLQAGFTETHVVAIEASPILVARVETFLSSSRAPDVPPLVRTTQGTAVAPHINQIRINPRQLTSTDEAVRLLSHEIGHATGTQQARPTTDYRNPGAYNRARTLGEGEALWLEYQTAKERGSQHISGDSALWAQLETARDAALGAGLSEAEVRQTLIYVAAAFNGNSQPNDTPPGTTYNQQNMFHWAMDACGYDASQRDRFSISDVARGIGDLESDTWTLDIRSAANATGEVLVCQKSARGTPIKSVEKNGTGVRLSDTDRDGLFDKAVIPMPAPQGSGAAEFGIRESADGIEIRGISTAPDTLDPQDLQAYGFTWQKLAD